MKFSSDSADDRMFQGVNAQAPIKAIRKEPRRRFIYAGNSALRSFEAETQLALKFVPICARTKARPQNAAPARERPLAVQYDKMVSGSHILFRRSDRLRQQ